jgi:hypothetical protein
VANVWNLHILVVLHRNPKDQQLVDYTITKNWYTGKYTDRPRGRQSHSALLGEGSFLYPQPIHDVRLALESLTAEARHRAAPNGPSTPGRERSGFENVPLPLALQTQHPQEQPEPTTAPESPTPE